MKILTYILILMMALAWNGCSSEPSAINQLRNEYDNRLDGLRLPASPSSKEKRALDQPQDSPTQEKTLPIPVLDEMP